jgi:hypothetical protein
MDFDEWLKIGRDNHWVSRTVCDTHEGIPMSEDEEREFLDGDPCIHILRLYESKQEKIKVEGQ